MVRARTSTTPSRWSRRCGLPKRPLKASRASWRSENPPGASRKPHWLKEHEMSAQTPFLEGEAALGALASRYVDVESLPWKPTPTPGIDMKILLHDKESGLLTALFRWAPGTALDLHEHVEIEQTWVISGAIVDDEGEA